MRLNSRDSLAGTHDVAHMRQQFPAKGTAWMRSGKVFRLEATCVKQGDGQRITHCQLGH